MHVHLKAGLCAVLAAAALAAVPPSARAQGVKVDSDTFGGIEARSIGPATMSGRISAVAAVAGDRLTIFAGTAGGGVWKSVDGGLVFKPVFDKHTQAIGAIAIDPSNARTIWVGTGETWLRNSVSPGDGVYRSTDGGDSWTKLGLDATERIARVLVHPKDGNVAFVCATGHAFDDHPDRGVYRTKDAGKTWEKTLYVAPDVGCADLAMDPQDPNVLYAAMWQHRRKPWFFTSGGPRSGLYRSRDGGATWEPLVKGIPVGDLGRISLAISPAKPSTVYAAIEAKKTALYRSDDRGDTWRYTSDSTAVTTRPFYFSRLLADPANVERVYTMGQGASVSDDGGKSFAGLGGGGLLGPSYHSDVHDIWVNPKNPEQLVIGTDGGVYMLVRPRQHVPLRGQPARGPVLPRQLRHGVAVQRVRRPPGQQHVVRPVAEIRRHTEPRLAVAHRWRRILGVSRSLRPGRRLRRIPGRQPLPHPEVDAREQGHQADAQGGRTEVPLQLEHPDPSQPDRPGHALLRRAVPVPLARQG